MLSTQLSRRSWLHSAGLGSLLAGLLTGSRRASGAAQEPGGALESGHLAHGHQLGTVGRVSSTGFDPMRYLRSHNFNHLPLDAQSRFYRETPRPDGSLLREYDIYAVDRDIEIATEVIFPEWTYNGQVHGPAIRAP